MSTARAVCMQHKTCKRKKNNAKACLQVCMRAHFFFTIQLLFPALAHMCLHVLMHACASGLIICLLSLHGTYQCWTYPARAVCLSSDIPFSILHESSEKGEELHLREQQREGACSAAALKDEERTTSLFKEESIEMSRHSTPAVQQRGLV